MWKKLGHSVRQPSGYNAFIPLSFPPEKEFALSLMAPENPVIYGRDERR